MPIGCTTLSGIAVLENPRILSGKAMLFDVHFFIYDTPDSTYAGVSLLRYFNTYDMRFGEVEKYFVHAEVALMDEKCNVDFLTPETSKEDYFMVGEILQLIPADRDVKRTEDTKYSPLLTIGAIVEKIDDQWKKNPRSFRINVNPEVYVQLLQPPKPPKNSNNNPQERETPNPLKKQDHIYGHMPVQCFVPDSSRWAQPPTVRVGNYVTMAGYLQNVRRNDSNKVIGFDIELERVTYMGQPSDKQMGTPPVFKRVAGSPAGSSTPPQKKMRFSYNYQDTPTPASRRGQANST